MFREMKKSRQALPEAEVYAVLERGSHGILACLGDEGYPYAVPLNYVYWNGKIYVHSAKEGHKVDAIVNEPKVSFAVVDADKILSDKYTSLFRSVIAFGKARIVEGDERTRAFDEMVEKYSGDRPEEEKRKIVANCERAYIIAIDIEHVTGKEQSMLARARETGKL